MTVMSRQPEVVSIGDEISMESSLNRLRSLDLRHLVMTEVETDTVTILPDGTVSPMDTETIVPIMEGLHILRSSIRWVQPKNGVGVSESKKIREVIVTKPFFAVRSTAQFDHSGFTEHTDGTIREEDGGPIVRSSREEILRLYAFMALLLVLWIVWSKVTRCRVSGR